VELTNAALHSLMDLLDNRATAWPDGEPSASPRDEGAPPSSAPPRVGSPDTDEEADDLDMEDVEDAVLRELARSLQPRR
jgi:hypothetical protein